MIERFSNFEPAFATAAARAASVIAPTLTRLEPSIADGTPQRGVEARIHDPLWFLFRQWQFGEFVGEERGISGARRRSCDERTGDGLRAPTQTLLGCGGRSGRRTCWNRSSRESPKPSMPTATSRPGWTPHPSCARCWTINPRSTHRES